MKLKTVYRFTVSTAERQKLCKSTSTLSLIVDAHLY